MQSHLVHEESSGRTHFHCGSQYLSSFSLDIPRNQKYQVINLNWVSFGSWPTYSKCTSHLRSRVYACGWYTLVNVTLLLLFQWICFCTLIMPSLAQMFFCFFYLNPTKQLSCPVMKRHLSSIMQNKCKSKPIDNFKSHKKKLLWWGGGEKKAM